MKLYTVDLLTEDGDHYPCIPYATSIFDVEEKANNEVARIEKMLKALFGEDYYYHYAVQKMEVQLNACIEEEKVQWLNRRKNTMPEDYYWSDGRKELLESMSD